MNDVLLLFWPTAEMAGRCAVSLHLHGANDFRALRFRAAEQYKCAVPGYNIIIILKYSKPPRFCVVSTRNKTRYVDNGHG